MAEKSSSVRDIASSYFPMHMFQDHKTEMYIKFAKVMVIYQGSYTDERGKSLENVNTKFKTTGCILSDITYRNDNNSMCSFDKTDEYFNYFKELTKKALEEGNNLIVIDQTVSNIDTHRYYFSLAYKFQYVTVIIPPMTSSDNIRSSHSWPKGSLAYDYKKNVQSFNDKKFLVNNFRHLFCGWFLHDVDSHDLRKLAGLYAQDCLGDCETFANIYNKFDIFAYDNFMEFYNMQDTRQNLAYCAVKIFENMMSQIVYFDKEEVKAAYGKIDKLTIVGFIFSPYVVAARVKISHSQKSLWDNQDRISDDSLPQSLPTELINNSIKNLPNVDAKLIYTKSNTTLTEAKYTTEKPQNSIPSYAKERTCHIILGRRTNAPAKKIDKGVAMALAKEQKEDDMECLPNCLVKKVGEFWFVYMKKFYTVNALFASCCEPHSYDQETLAFLQTSKESGTPKYSSREHEKSK